MVSQKFVDGCIYQPPTKLLQVHPLINLLDNQTRYSAYHSC